MKIDEIWEKIVSFGKSRIDRLLSPKFLKDIIVILILVVIFSSPILIFLQVISIHVNAIFYSNSILDDISNSIPSNVSSDTVFNILDWQKKNFILTYAHPLNAYCKSISLYNLNTVFLTQCGSCGEYTYAFVEIAKRKNLTVRQINNIGIDHTWAEVFENGEWIPVDSTMGRDGYNDSKFYDCSYTGGLKYVFVNYSQDIDITSKYICENDLVHLQIQSTPNSLILIKTPGCNMLAPCNLFRNTDKNGFLEVNLSKGNYTISTDSFFLFTEEKNASLVNTYEQIEFSPTLNIQRCVFFSGIILFFVGLGMIIGGLFLKTKQTRKNQ